MNHDTHDQVDTIAIAAATNWTRLLRVHHRRLPAADLEDCLSQALLELLVAAEQGRTGFADRAAALTALDRRFQSRIIDRHRAHNGRSPITTALHHARPLDTITDAARPGAAGDPVQRLLDRETLTRIAGAVGELTPNQRLALLAQLHGERPGEFCARHGWSPAKHRKTLQRARARLRLLLR
jgi:DNA-directed RNA polymerase specialized sigma24 family protein